MEDLVLRRVEDREPMGSPTLHRVLRLQFTQAVAHLQRGTQVTRISHPQLHRPNAIFLATVRHRAVHPVAAALAWEGWWISE